MNRVALSTLKDLRFLFQGMGEEGQDGEEYQSSHTGFFFFFLNFRPFGWGVR